MKYDYNLNVFYKENALSYYLLGVFCTDGNVYIPPKRKSGRCQIDSKDENWLRQIADYICPAIPVYPDKRSNCFRISFYSNEIVNWLIDHGCKPAKSLTLKFPNIPNIYLSDFIRGCWDGDGTLGLYNIYRKDHKCYETSRSCKLYSGSKSFTESMIIKLKQLDINATIIVRTHPERKINNRIIAASNLNNYMICVQNKQNIINFCEKIYYTDNCLSLDRKFKIAKELLNNIYSLKYPPSNEIINHIRSDYNNLNLKELSIKYNISKTTIRRIVNKRGRYSSI